MSGIGMMAGLCICAMLGGSFAHDNIVSEPESHLKQNLFSLVVSQAVELKELKSLVQAQAKEDKEKMQALETEISSLKAASTYNGPTPHGPTPQVVFTARYNNYGVNLNVGTGGTLKYPVVVTNIGNGYDPLTGHFTAPYAGTYAFFASLRSTNDHGWIVLSIMKGNQMLIPFTADGKSDLFDRGVGFATTRLEKGEQVHVKQNGGGTYLEKGALTNFSGMLLAAD